jgi:hypothetical protein
MWLWVLLGLATWAAADAHFRSETQALHEQLANDERELSARQETDHAHIRDGEPMPTNRAGYRSAADLNNSPSRTGAGPTVRTNREATR